MYAFICDNCKEGTHYACEVAEHAMTEDNQVGAGMCVCDHDDRYDSPDEVWAKSRMEDEGGPAAD